MRRLPSILVKNEHAERALVPVGEPRVPQGHAQYQELCAQNFHTLEVGEHVTNSFREFVVAYVVKAANGVVMNVELDDQFGETTKIHPEDDFTGWWIEF